MSYAMRSPTTGLCHGDPRLENFYFFKDEKTGERSVGVLDFQLLILSSVLQDIAWFVTTSLYISFADKHEEELLFT